MNMAPALKRSELPGAERLVTEDSAALAFVAAHRDRLRYCHSSSTWFEFDGVAWRRDKTHRAFHFARELARRMAKTEADRIKYVTSKNAFANGVEIFAKRDPALATTADQWDPDPWQLGTPGGTVDLRTGTLRKARADDRITKLTACAPARKAECPIWGRFLAEATGGDRELVRFLQRFAGYALTGSIKEHALLFPCGPGGNGKSVLINTIGRILGDYTVVAAMETFVTSAFDRPTADLAMLAGARLVVASETEEGRAWAEARIKSITGGDPITARFMRQNFFTFQPQFKLAIVGNHRPSLSAVDDAIRRRFNIVPFLHRPIRPDPDLEEKLRAEWPAILRWMIDGCLDWQRHGLGRPRAVADATDEYLASQDLFSQWLDECCEVELGNEWKSCASGTLYASWSRYALAAGERAGTQKQLAERLKSRGLSAKRSTGGMRVWLGIRLRPGSNEVTQ